MHSVLFHIGPIPIRAYGLMLWIGLMLGLFRTIRAGKKQGIPSDHIIDIVLISVIAGVIGAHIASILLDLPLYIQHPSDIIGLWKGILSPSGGLKGLSFHGGLIGGIGAAYLYCRWKKINFPIMLDLCTPAIALAYGITRIGCFLNGCCYGIPTDLPWGVCFPVDGSSGAMTAPSHPVQLYAFAVSVAMYFVLARIESRRRFVWQVFLSYTTMYAVYRFLAEFLRKGVTAEVAFAGLTEAQIVSIVMFAVSVPILYIKLKRSKQEQQSL